VSEKEYLNISEDNSSIGIYLIALILRLVTFMSELHVISGNTHQGPLTVSLC